ncbi:MAG: hypothetical protein OEZ68_16420 [Gammaproteobacteria bacterium]|nr:hypothetical protein [Gammaproteobacteria bacterium]MDH5802387.1 hypothetical protein [Gammaproteobacteria bacterium]
MKLEPYCLVILCVLLSACKSTVQTVKKTPTPPPPAITYYYQMPLEEQVFFKNKLSNIDIGDSLNDIKENLGSTDYETSLYTRGEKRAFIGSVYTYYTEKFKQDIVDKKDKQIVLYFDANNRLIFTKTNINVRLFEFLNKTAHNHRR